MTRNERYTYILDYFRAQSPVVTTELEFGSAFQLLVATLLSAQCTDKRINQVTPALFKRFPTAEAMAKADVDEVYELVKSVSYPNAKANHLVAMSRKLVDDFKGEMPSTTAELTTLPGVGRKTANVLQAVWFDKPNMAVDTHVYRVSHRMGLVSKKANTPLKVEQELLRHIPTADVNKAHHWLLLHGRYVCTSRKAKCEECVFKDICPKLLEGSKLE
jgi:endonuclease III